MRPTNGFAAQRRVFAGVWLSDVQGFMAQGASDQLNSRRPWIFRYGKMTAQYRTHDGCAPSV
ncbi:MAG: hypothetical protein RSB04_00680 [Gordonibacter sp.]|uniref:hypothetical protein n=1 Tax=Gordonibacter sp. TaxID=1968902 RepID=UPI002FC5EBE0